VLTVNHFSTAAQVVQRSDLLTVFPRSYVPASGVAQDLVIRAFPQPLPRIEIGLLWHRRHERDAGHRWLRALVARVAAGVAPAFVPAAPVPATHAASA
jgi:DNA-binding transcriptional LysR family regulator